MALISTLFILLFRVVLSLFRGPRKDEGEKKKIIVILQWQNEMAQISHQRNVWLWLACKAWLSIDTNLSFTCLVFMWHFLLSVQREVLELFCILHLLDILSYKCNVCLVSHSHFHYLWGIFLTQIWSSSNGVSHKSVVNLFITMITKCILLFSGSLANLI